MNYNCSGFILTFPSSASYCHHDIGHLIGWPSSLDQFQMRLQVSGELWLFLIVAINFDPMSRLSFDMDVDWPHGMS